MCMNQFLVTILIFKWKSVLCGNDNNTEYQNVNFIQDPQSISLDQNATTISDKCYVVQKVAKLDNKRSENAAGKRKITKMILTKSDIHTNLTESTSTIKNQTDVKLSQIKNDDISKDEHDSAQYDNCQQDFLFVEQVNSIPQKKIKTIEFDWQNKKTDKFVSKQIMRSKSMNDVKPDCLKMTPRYDRIYSQDFEPKKRFKFHAVELNEFSSNIDEKIFIVTHDSESESSDFEDEQFKRNEQELREIREKYSSSEGNFDRVQNFLDYLEETKKLIIFNSDETIFLNVFLKFVSHQLLWHKLLFSKKINQTKDKQFIENYYQIKKNLTFQMISTDFMSFLYDYLYENPMQKNPQYLIESLIAYESTIVDILTSEEVSNQSLIEHLDYTELTRLNFYVPVNDLIKFLQKNSASTPK